MRASRPVRSTYAGTLMVLGVERRATPSVAAAAEVAGAAAPGTRTHTTATARPTVAVRDPSPAIPVPPCGSCLRREDRPRLSVKDAEFPAIRAGRRASVA